MNTKTKFRHTAGPWVVNPTGESPIIGIALDDGGPLLPIVDSVSGYDLPEADANARLIVAAPDMVRLLAALLDGDVDARAEAIALLAELES